jgi:hypothetical protein
MFSIFQLGLHFELVLLLGGREGTAGVGSNFLSGNYVGSNCLGGNYVGSRVLHVGGVERCGNSRVDDLLKIQRSVKSL